MLLFVSLGSSYLLLSVGVDIYRRRHAVATGQQVSTDATDAELHGCWEDLSDVAQSLEKHLENFHHLLGGYDPDEAQRWASEGALWRNQATILGQRCRFTEVRGTKLRKEFEEMAAAHDELRETEAIYTKELLRFGRDQVPRLDRLKLRIERIGGRIEKAASQTGEKTP